jgi:hypothetical protein
VVNPRIRSFPRQRSGWSPLDLLAVERNELPPDVGFIFTDSVYGKRKGSPQLMTRRIQRFLPAAGVGPSDQESLTSHCYRNGAVSQTLLAGYSTTEVKAYFDWRRGNNDIIATYFDHHLRRSAWSAAFVPMPAQDATWLMAVTTGKNTARKATEGESGAAA